MKFPPKPEILKAKMQNLADHLPEKQAEEMARYLNGSLGQNVGNENSYAAAHDTSHKNLERILGSGPRRNADSEIANAVAHRWVRDFRHNTNQFPGDIQAQPFWLSSRSLRHLNLPEGLQSKPFNTEFVGTGNWIFFFVGDSKEYGNTSVYVNHEHAQQAGMIFPFVMTIKDLALTYEQATGTKIEVGEISFEEMLIKPDLREKLTEARRNLAKFMFTPDDFENLGGTLLARHLSALAQSDSEKYKKTIDSLKSPKLTNAEIQSIMRESFARSGIPLRYEMRIPVAIPTKHMFMPNCPERVAPSAAPAK